MQQTPTTEPETIEPLLITVPMAAKRVGMDKRKVRRLIQAGEFPHKIVAGRTYVPLQRLIEWANATDTKGV